MRPQIGHFLQYLSVERGASPHTLKGYREDLHALAEYLSDGEGHTPAPGSITTNELRGFLYVPPGRGPFPAVLWNHGSERLPGWQPEQLVAKRVLPSANWGSSGTGLGDRRPK